jgi:hypothetical protein
MLLLPAALTLKMFIPVVSAAPPVKVVGGAGPLAENAPL